MAVFNFPLKRNAKSLDNPPGRNLAAFNLARIVLAGLLLTSLFGITFCQDSSKDGEGHYLMQHYNFFLPSSMEMPQSSSQINSPLDGSGAMGAMNPSGQSVQPRLKCVVNQPESFSKHVPALVQSMGVRDSSLVAAVIPDFEKSRVTDWFLAHQIFASSFDPPPRSA